MHIRITTEYIYGVTLSDSTLASNSLVRAEKYRVEYTYNRQAQQISMKDQLGTVHNLEYDKLGRPTHDRVTNLASGVDNAVLRLSPNYEVRGMVTAVTSYNNGSVGSCSAVNEVAMTYNDFGQQTDDYQSHSGAANSFTTPKVQLAYANGSTNAT